MNKATIEKAVNAIGYNLGCYGKLIDTLTQANVKKVIAELTEESTDIQIINKRIKYIVTIDTVDNEKDISIRTLTQYEAQFGELENR